MSKSDIRSYARHRDRVVDDGPSTFEMVDSEEQGLEFRVGPVYHGSDIDSFAGIWITYQPKYLASSPQGPFLMSPETWAALKKHVDAKVRRFRASAYKGK